MDYALALRQLGGNISFNRFQSTYRHYYKVSALRETVLHVGRQIDDFTAYTWYETVDAADHRSKQGLMDLSEVSLTFCERFGVPL